MHLVVGLGNPGSEYAGTRHNVGWEALDRLARRLGWIRSEDEFNRVARNKFEGLALDGASGPNRLLLLKPTTFMNCSGRSVLAAMQFYQLGIEQVIIVLDDLALPSGRIRLRSGGSSGGHNGLKDIAQVLGHEQYARLRVGIDAPPPRVPQRDYVLGRFSPEQRKLIDPALDRAGEALLSWIDFGIEKTMSLFNTSVKEKESE